MVLGLLLSGCGGPQDAGLVYENIQKQSGSKKNNTLLIPHYPIRFLNYPLIPKTIINYSKLLKFFMNKTKKNIMMNNVIYGK